MQTDDQSRNSITAQRATEYNLPPQGPDESDSDFRARVSGTLRDMGHIIESHEAHTNKLYDNNNDIATAGIAGAVAQVLCGKNYHCKGSAQVGNDIMAGHIAKGKSGPFDGMSPATTIMACLLLGGR